MRVVPILKPVLGDGVHFVDEDYTHVVILGPVKNASDEADRHGGDLRSRQGHEAHPLVGGLGAFLKLLLELACHGPGDEGLAHARRAQQQRALGNSDVIAVVQELLRQHVNDALHVRNLVFTAHQIFETGLDVGDHLDALRIIGIGGVSGSALAPNRVQLALHVPLDRGHDGFHLPGDSVVLRAVEINAVHAAPKETLNARVVGEIRGILGLGSPHEESCEQCLLILDQLRQNVVFLRIHISPLVFQFPDELAVQLVFCGRCQQDPFQAPVEPLVLAQHQADFILVACNPDGRDTGLYISLSPVDRPCLKIHR